MNIGHLIVTGFGLLVVLFGAWYLNQLNKGEIK